MKRGEWHEKAREMVAAGMSHRAVARELGVQPSAVTKAVHPELAREWRRKYEARPERKAAKRAWEREVDRGECEICGAKTWKRKTTRCRLHHAQRDAAWRRRTEIADRWAAGELIRDIAEALGSTTASIGVEMAHMRRDGWDLPYRYNVTNGKRMAA